MIVDDETLEKLKPWVEKSLSQVVDSDVDIMTTYVLALLKHDLPINELRKMCEAQLEDFLHKNTVPFVDSLIKALEDTIRYMKEGGPNPFSSDSSKEAAENQEVTQEPGFQQPATNQGQDQDSSMADDYIKTQQQGNNLSLSDNNGLDQFHGQEQFRANFRRDRRYNDNDNDSFRNNGGYGQFNQGMAPYPPQNLAYLPPFDLNGPVPPQFPPEYLAYLQTLQAAGVSRPRRNRRQNRFNSDYQNAYDSNHLRRNSRPYTDEKASSKYTSPLSGKKIENDYSNTKLVVEKIPEDKFNEASAREYFSKFGNLLQVNVNEKLKVIELEYEAHDQARAAYESPEAVFNNRFVKVYWRKVNQDAKGPIEPKIDVEAVARIQQAKQKEFEEKRAKRLEHEAKMKQILEMKSSILQEQKNLLLQQAQNAASDGSNSDALRIQLEALKAEAESLGIDSSDSGSSFSPFSRRGRGRGSSGYRGRGSYRGISSHPYAYRGGRGGHATSQVDRQRFNLDLRPKSVLVTPVPEDKEEALRSHLLHFGGEYENVQRSSTEPGFIIDFKDRKSAEMFFRATESVPDVGAVELHWQQRRTQSMSPEAMDMN
ncbi:hypothetical protein AWJ20_3157 [Sugiyamaella lignohabitans]|uniref:U1 small nuclear ribonucleoprotein component SNU71 n=1 Tax=Sugiyamaella lignohabitans TaxID=796027 RepID=A0A167FP23_9ASCO|nr:uncharacterized protein AWJ20_3157 [Sugiyamaella lignohabitans]ANB15529.1 hypothetical protein AWJ20_3157 [Sugiyamaella lignohabitans]